MKAFPFRGAFLLALSLATAVAASAQSRGGGPGGGGRGGGDRPVQSCADAAAGPPSRQQLADLAPPDPLAALHSLMTERRPALQLTPTQAPVFDAMLRDLKDLVDVNERRFWRVVATGPVSAAASSDLAHQLSNDGDEEQDRLAAIKDFLQDWAQLRAGMNAEQLALLDTAWRDSHLVAARRRPAAVGNSGVEGARQPSR